MTPEQLDLFKRLVIKQAAKAGERPDEAVIELLAASLICEENDPLHINGLEFHARLEAALLKRAAATF